MVSTVHLVSKPVHPLAALLFRQEYYAGVCLKDIAIACESANV